MQNLNKSLIEFCILIFVKYYPCQSKDLESDLLLLERGHIYLCFFRIFI
jgi:hypothetical protein